MIERQSKAVTVVATVLGIVPTIAALAMAWTYFEICVAIGRDLVNQIGG